jgi:hypothetical protein
MEGGGGVGHRHTGHGGGDRRLAPRVEGSRCGGQFSRVAR